LLHFTVVSVFISVLVPVSVNLKSAVDHTPNLLLCVPLSGVYMVTFSTSVLCRDICILVFQISLWIVGSADRHTVWSTNW